ncbi:hypothetical protein ABHI18_009148 [Aspergillus niger]
MSPENAQGATHCVVGPLGLSRVHQFGDKRSTWRLTRLGGLTKSGYPGW